MYGLLTYLAAGNWTSFSLLIILQPQVIFMHVVLHEVFSLFTLMVCIFS